MALALYKTVPAEAYSRIGDKELQKFGGCLNTEQRWYALSLANALSADGITKPALPHLEKFHVMRLHPLGTYESYADMIVRISVIGKVLPLRRKNNLINQQSGTFYSGLFFTDNISRLIFR